MNNLNLSIYQMNVKADVYKKLALFGLESKMDFEHFTEVNKEFKYRINNLERVYSNIMERDNNKSNFETYYTQHIINALNGTLKSYGGK